MKYNGKNYKIQYQQLLILLILIFGLFTSIIFGAKIILSNMQPTSKHPVTLNTQATNFNADGDKQANKFVEQYFPKGKNPPPPVPPKVPPPPSDQKFIALTFDDGPGYNSTARILDTLQKHNIKATFFVLGSMAEKNPDMLKRIHSEGHEIANHSYSHPNLTKLSVEEIKNQIQSTNTIVKNTTGVDIQYLRPPYGAINQALKDNTQLTLVLWNVDSNDWKLKDGVKIKEHVIATLKNQSIILFHDIYESSADAIDLLIPELINRGYQFVTIQEYEQLVGF